ncbi:sulfite exporter TauE/SafE family protein [Arsenicicoccus dermatophilus]|uniref:sulfite exporter TauE/SafE family protein n=1 Tax=Arsenicicoccus dermatophilus TaxID=1076331 RepID=UPI001F4C8314|nr:sulfite exporter TauE/SafE family protein [Arsenicicoccus dermatophilus]
MTPWLIPLAVLVGLLLGALGGGGAILTVPILTYLLHLAPAAATTGSLIVVGLSSLVGLLPRLRAGEVRVADGLTFGLLGTAGALVGSRLSTQVPGPILMTSFAALLLLVAALMWRRRSRGRTAGATPQPRGWPVRIAAATGVGLLTGFFGVGGGFVVVPTLTLVLGLPMTTAVATSLLVIALNAATSLAARAAGGLVVDWSVILPFALLAVVGTLLGAPLGRRVGQARLQSAFAVLLVLVAAGVAIGNVPQLF